LREAAARVEGEYRHLGLDRVAQSTDCDREVVDRRLDDDQYFIGMQTGELGADLFRRDPGIPAACNQPPGQRSTGQPGQTVSQDAR
jgi:hypothetical protein